MNVGRTLRVFAVYLAGLAVALLFAPNVLLSLFGMPETTEVWIRVVGMLVAVLALYYWTAGRTEFLPFARASVLARGAVPLFFLAFVIEGWATWPLLLFGIADAAGAAWTWMALRSDASS